MAVAVRKLVDEGIADVPETIEFSLCRNVRNIYINLRMSRDLLFTWFVCLFVSLSVLRFI